MRLLTGTPARFGRCAPARFGRCTHGTAPAHARTTTATARIDHPTTHLPEVLLCAS